MLRVAGCVWVVLFCAIVSGESTRGRIHGSITDASGAAVEAARVLARQPGSGLAREAVTDSRGYYALAGLEVGGWQLTVVKEGFRELVIEAVDLAVGQTQVRDARLEVGMRSEVVEVREASAMPAADNAELGGVIDGEQLKGMPINGRNWQGLLALAPGAVNTGAGDARGIRFFGRGVDDNNFRFDGVDVTGVRNQVPRDDVRLAIPMEAIGEFRVRAGMYSAESGGSMAAQVELVSRTGSNEWHGSGFEYLRNNHFDSRSPFDPQTIPPFHLNQFGASLGGPIRKGSTFFFLAYEGLSQRLTRTLVGTVPSDALRRRAVTTNPGLAAYLDAYPRSSELTSSGDIARWTGPGSQNNDQHSGVARIDQNWSERWRMFGRFSTNRMEVRTPQGDSTGNIDAYNGVSEHVTNGVVEWLYARSARTLNEVRAGVNRVPYTSKYDSRILPGLRVSGLTSIPGARESLVNSMTGTLADTLSLIRGRHSVKVGVETRRLRFALRTVADGSAIVFTDVNAFAEGRVNTATLNGFLPTHGVSKTQWSSFAQDEIRVRPNLTVQAGIRYDSFGVLKEDHDRAQAFDITTCGGFCPAGTSFTMADLNNVAPRLSVAWAPERWLGRTVVRAGAGMFYGEGQLGNQTSPVENETVRLSLSGPQLDRVSLADLLLPILPPAAGSLTISPLNLERNRRDMYTSQWTAQVGQQLAGAMVLETVYAGSKGSQLFARTYVNLIQPSTGRRPLPQYGLIPVRSNGANSTFHGWTTSLRRTRAAWSVGASYQWSHAIDEYAAGGDDSGYPQNVLCRRCERASSDFDIRHTFQLNGSIRLPLGLTLSGLTAARSGRAVNVTVSRASTDLPDGNATSPQRPDVTGLPVQPAASGTAGWLNLDAFRVPANGTWGNAGRNLGRGPAIFNLDAALTKYVALGERVGLDIRAESFNLLNHPQYATQQANISSPATFGRILQIVNTGATGSGTPRQFEISIRLTF